MSRSRYQNNGIIIANYLTRWIYKNLVYQRGGPSTGLPTRHGQDDLRFAIHASHGEFPRIIVCSGDIEECFYDAARAFNYAERYQTPVIHLIDKALANSNKSYKIFDPYQNELVSTFQERISQRITTYPGTPPAKEIIADNMGEPVTSIKKMLDELKVTG